MAYTALARRYRSRSFDELVGQDPVARTLRKAIETNRVAHAYLFTGTRGVGKTSTARIFAKALNAPGDEPADVAEAIMQGRDTDVIEIDGASNNKVEEARELIANSVYRPLRGRYKVYIIDEVHMLTTQAFNALLKTMEEPPEHVVFVLCTTEAHKVPATIQSRCQRFDFRALPTAQIAAHLGEVARAEGAEADAELLHAAARLGNGSMRDALSLLDRLLASGEKRLTVGLLESLLGLPDRQLIHDLVEGCATGDPAVVLARADELQRRGVSPDQLVETLAERLRDLMVLGVCGPETELVDLPPEARRTALEQARKFDTAGLVHMIALCDASGRSLRNSSAPRAILDAVLVRLALTERFADAAAVAAGAGVTVGRFGSGAAAAGGPEPKKH
ncbi:MAG: DNA polymerase III subunit gamma/tau [Phycisphaerae bacterium]|nr:DNA polymerase III subunit gamma/tau [Phycisphaerae bacterium]